MNGQLCYITPVSGGHPDQGLPPGEPGTPTHPIELPPLPPGTKPEHPITLPPGGGTPSHPIFVPIEPAHPIAGEPPTPSHPIAGGGEPVTPEHPISLPPGTIWPPLNPGDGVQGKGLLLVIVVGSDGRSKYKWVVVDAPSIWPQPPVAQPK